MKLVIPFLIVAAVGAALVVALAGRAQATTTPVATPRWKVQVRAFDAAIGSYGGSACCTKDGLILGWDGRRNNAGDRSALFALRPPDQQLRQVSCIGGGPVAASTFGSLAMDAEAQTIYVFGGWGNANAPTADLCRLPLRQRQLTWEAVEVMDPATAPRPRNGAAAVFDSAHQRLIVVGGDAGPGTAFTPLADAWQFDVVTSRWSALAASGDVPPARWHAAMAANPGSHRAYLFGGAGRAVPFDAALYELDLDANRWRRVPTTGDPPPSLQGATFTFDAAHGVFVLAGGLRHVGPGSGTLSDVWVYDPGASQWDRADGGDAVRRRDHMAAYDPVSGNHYLLGGRVSATVGNFYDRGAPVTTCAVLTVSPVATSPITRSNATQP